MRAIAIVVAVIILPAVAMCQVPSGFVRYGSSLPELRQREYIISAWGDFRDWTRTDEPESPMYHSTTKLSGISVSFRATYGVTDHVIAGATLRYSPELTTLEHRDAMGETVYDVLSLGSFYPQVSIALRPTDGLEFYVDWRSSESTTECEYFRSVETATISDTTWKVGLNWAGSL